MIYNEKYQIKFYKNSANGENPVLAYLEKQDLKTRNKINKYINFLSEHSGYLDEPYSKHIKGKIRELRVDFFNNHHRIFYFSFFNKKIILLSAFAKQSDKTPQKEIKKAIVRYLDVINNPQLYE